MTPHADIPAEAEADTSTRRIGWFAFWGGAIAWTAHIFLAYGVAEFGCVSGLGRWTMLGISGVSWLLILVTVVTLGIAAGATIAGWSAVRDPEGLGGTPPQTIAGGRYLSRVGVIMSVLFAFTILVQSVPILWYLGGC